MNRMPDNVMWPVDHFACMVMRVLLERPENYNTDNMVLASIAYDVAEDMMKERHNRHKE